MQQRQGQTQVQEAKASLDKSSLATDTGNAMSMSLTETGKMDDTGDEDIKEHDESDADTTMTVEDRARTGYTEAEAKELRRLKRRQEIRDRKEAEKKQLIVNMGQDLQEQRASEQGFVTKWAQFINKLRPEQQGKEIAPLQAMQVQMMDSLSKQLGILASPASFYAEVKEFSNLKRRAGPFGVVSTKNFKFGDIIMFEWPLFHSTFAWPNKISSVDLHVDLLKQVVEYASKIKATAIEFLTDSHMTMNAIKMDPELIRRVPKLAEELKLSANQVYNTLRRIVEYSKELWSPTSTLGMGLAIYPVFSMMDHSCDANCEPFFQQNGTMSLFAKRPIKRGEELRFCYAPDGPSRPIGTRINSIPRFKESFVCDCELCGKGKPYIDLLTGTGLNNIIRAVVAGAQPLVCPKHMADMMQNEADAKAASEEQEKRDKKHVPRRTTLTDSSLDADWQGQTYSSKSEQEQDQEKNVEQPECKIDKAPNDKTSLYCKTHSQTFPANETPAARVSKMLRYQHNIKEYVVREEPSLAWPLNKRDLRIMRARVYVKTANELACLITAVIQARFFYVHVGRRQPSKETRDLLATAGAVVERCLDYYLPLLACCILNHRCEHLPGNVSIEQDPLDEIHTEPIADQIRTSVQQGRAQQGRAAPATPASESISEHIKSKIFGETGETSSSTKMDAGDKKSESAASSGEVPLKEEKKRAEDIEQDEVNRDAAARDLPDACHWSAPTMIRMMNLLLRRDAAFATMRSPRHSLQIMSATLCIFADYLNLGYPVEGLQSLSRMRDKNVVIELFERFHKWETFLKNWSFLPFTGHGGHQSPVMLKLLTITGTLLDAKSPLLTAPIDPHKTKTRSIVDARVDEAKVVAKISA